MSFGVAVRIFFIRMLFICFVLFGLFFYIGWNLMEWLQALGYEPSLRSTILCTWLIGCSYLFGRIPLFPLALRMPFLWLGSYVFFWMEWLLILLPVANAIAWGSRVITGTTSPSLVLTLGWMIAAILLVGTIMGSYLARKPVVRTYSVRISKPLPDGQPKRILLVSDLHAGYLIGRRHLQRLVDLANKAQPDLVLIAGDVLDDDVKPFLANQMERLLGEIQAPLGVFAVLGNHEYYGGGIQPYIQAMDAAGIRVLQDQQIVIPGFGTIIGRKDLTANRLSSSMGTVGRLTIQQLMLQADRSQPVIVMDHQPKEIRQAEHAGVDLIVGGHTHLGQVWPNQWITRTLFDLDYGYRTFGHTHAVVSSGWGTWGPPIRIGSQCEAVLIEWSSNA